ncbi:tetratricopeptide repeat-containing sulfotransferase family protein [Profundibacter sp.]|uniref:tetratricopeptide repeat-containing sulfotransferase family protein n=1 Tax=Profundibacter sp. TaxID=3101071 RepID=UPI003D09C54C
MATNAKALADKIMAQMQAGDFARAVKGTKTAHKKFPKEPYFANLAGMALAQAGNEREAALFFNKALRMAPKDQNYQNNLVQALVMSGQHEKAQALIGKLLAKRADTSDLYYQLAMSQMRSGNGDMALDSLVKALEANPSHAKAHNLRGIIYSEMGRDADAVADYEASLAIAPDNPETLANLSLPLSRLNREEEGLTALERALRINPSHLASMQRYASQLNELGRKEEAKAALHTLSAAYPAQGDAMHQLAQIQTAEENAALLPLIEKALAKMPNNAPDRVALNFALSVIHWQAGDIVAAARALKAANGQYARQHPFDMARETQEMADILALFPIGSPPAISRSADGPTPVFVIGQPRSGTTLTEQILTLHPEVAGFGELATAGRLVESVLQGGQGFDPEGFAADYIQSLPDLPETASAFVDKMPANYRYVGFLASALPQARFVWLQRDPRDVALSMWRAYFPRPAMGYTFGNL